MEIGMKVSKLVPCILALSLAGALAEVPAPSLAPGKAAGLHQAQLEGGTGMILLAGAALVAVAVVLATSDDSSGPSQTNVPPPTTTTTTTSP